MKSNVVEAPSAQWQAIDNYVAGYENDVATKGSAALADHLPPVGDPLRLSVLRELIRVELEFAADRGELRSLESYRAEYPELFADEAAVQAIAFEEHRLRLQAGERPSRHALSNSHVIKSRRPAANVGAESHLAPEQTRFVQQLEQVDAASAQLLSQALATLPAIGSDFLDFRLVAELGEGAYGRVYLAQQKPLADRFVALKVAANLSGEARHLAQLQHTNVVPLYSVHQAGPLQATCMPYFGPTTLASVLKVLRGRASLPASGQDLLSTLNEHKSQITQHSLPAGGGGGGAPMASVALPTVGHSHVTLDMLGGLTYVHAILWIGTRLADALAHAHDRGIVHRDLKPGNVLLSDEGQPMLLDFNLAESVKQPGRVIAAMVGGTLPYMAPEQLEGIERATQPLDPRSDLYALGVMLFELLTGQFPFPIVQSALPQLLPRMLADRRGKLPRIRIRNASVTPAAEAIVLKCMHPDPTKRYQSARDLQEDLQRHLDDRPLRHAPNPSWRERAAKWRRRHPRLASWTTMAVLGSLIVMGCAGLMAWQQSKVNRWHAIETGRQLHAAVMNTQGLLAATLPEPEEIREAQDLTTRILDQWHVADDDSWQTRAPWRHLTPETRASAKDDLVELLALRVRSQLLEAATTKDADRRQALLTEVTSLQNKVEALAGPEQLGLAWQRYLASRIEGEPDGMGEERLAALVPQSARDHRQLARLRSLEGKTRAARDLLLKATRLDPQDAHAWADLAANCLQEGQPANAVHAINVSIALWPRAARTHYLRGRAHLEAGDWNDAILDFDEALRLQPALLIALLDRVVAHVRLRHYAEALADLDLAGKNEAAPTRLYFMRARVYGLMGDRASADREVALGMGKAPTDEQSWLARGEARLPKDPKGALADFDAALNLNPRSRTAWGNKAHVLAEHLNDPGHAITALDESLKIFPEDAQAMASRAVLKARLGRRDDAIRDAAEALKFDGSASIAYQVAGAYALTSRDHPDDKRVAYRLLSSALSAGYGMELVDGDPDLASVRSDPEFQQIVQAARTLRARASLK